MTPTEASSDPLAPTRQTCLLRVTSQGRQIDIKSAEGLVVDVIVRTQKHDGTACQRLLQRLADTLRRAATACDSRERQGPIRITEVTVVAQAGCHELIQGRQLSVYQRLANRLTGGDCHYQTLFANDGVENFRESVLTEIGIKDGGGENENDFHSVLFDFFGGHFLIYPDDPSRQLRLERIRAWYLGGDARAPWGVA